ncbi:DUF29 domain-containing protein [Gammaproteobacteria bacterium]
MTTLSPHHQDFYSWTRQQSTLLKQHQFSELDIMRLAEEVEDMGNHVYRQLTSRLEVLLMHLLKWQFQPALQSKNWRLTIAEQRRRIVKLLRKNPSLTTEFVETLADAYEDARHSAMLETGLELENFPEVCPYCLEDVLNQEFYPATK